MTKQKTETLVRYLLISLAIFFSAMVISGCGGGGGSSTSGTPNIGLVPQAPTDFGVTVLDKSSDRHIEIWNTGSAKLSIGQITLPANPFSMIIDSCSGAVIPRGSNCELTIRFAPTTQADYSGSLDIPSNDPDGTVTATLLGKGRALNVSINRVIRVGQTVQVIVSVRDQSDAPVSTLAASNFTISENGSSNNIDNIYNAIPTGVSVGMVFDYSQSTIDYTSDLETAAKTFFDLLNPATDEAEVIKFANDIQLMQPFTQDIGLLKNAIDEPFGFVRFGSRLYDAIWESINHISLRSNLRQAIVAVSDGRDDMESIKTISEVTAGAVNNNVQIFTIGIGNNANNVVLGRLATETGGQYFFDPTSSDLTTVYSTISQILANEYTIEYTTSSAAGSTISINVVVDDNGRLGEFSKTVTL